MRHSALRKIIADTEAEIAYHESLVKKLQDKRQAARLELDSAAYPVLTLPPEITTEFFFWCLPTSYGNAEWNSIHSHEPPLLLTHVCRAWRNIAISTCALWANIELPMNLGSSAELFQAWLVRAGGSPRHLKLCELGWTIPSPAVLKTFVDFAAGIQVLELSNINLDGWKKMGRAASSWNFQSLQRLSIDFHTDRSASSVFKNTDVFTGLPLLRELSLRGASPSSISPPWHQLTKFTGKLYTRADCLNVLRLAPNLVECTFAAYRQPTVNVDGGVTHSNLQCLTFLRATSYRETASSADLLHAITLPALQSLSILDCGYEEFDDDALVAFLSRSTPPLRKFTIRQLPGTGLNITSLQSMSELVDIDIWGVRKDFVTTIFELFAFDTSFLPKLQHLALSGCNPRGSQPQVYQLLETVAPGLTARWNARHGREVAELESFRIAWDTDFGDLLEESLEPFEELLYEGLDIRLEGPEQIYVC
ncbi:hypothetical protein C8F04DRAFT_1154887 [Mycena alexandri]|uniref:F-box domain-containing protein n=1 Tax=Mycena alexandri TaxID=1745969 RepID=A0AAD6RYD4_9AGAR|nr:hypothetical protein C8F04DRAFT_1154887 [Mycena alexandri]